MAIKKLHTVEEFNDISEIHGVCEYDVTVGLEESERYEEHHMLRSHVTRYPYQLPGRENLL